MARKDVKKDWQAFERGSDEYIAESTSKGKWMSWIAEWHKRGEYESEAVAMEAIRHFQSQTGDKYIFEVRHGPNLTAQERVF